MGLTKRLSLQQTLIPDGRPSLSIVIHLNIDTIIKITLKKVNLNGFCCNINVEGHKQVFYGSEFAKLNTTVEAILS